ncbi:MULTISPECIES: putative 2-aminoethylphosphonate ABC transporter ATP-binding protein [unclassified Cupriavidus]|uniref:putative 2-aminoethylphosphonate ABC transporter ATP-binding protein n=1 Tax=unclassified Cupriavidus TaxID=2640874 RepID=UPI001C008992|nr:MULTISPECIES: putative 2-aminoethylphosphonate ABC transporter ATP-binding protein [unclassified Cupriavidus]MCA3186601.1 putative 2-aminoethylphosphonate ABC transporter ATP-binding protein [Cupriavidus sp.]MCA3188670.1 putative 2-aminoethylphosphonate ABC transporter ATP-binding protein [Cupriavidus sp.]MCA3199686.1 putative 2-aminoethylphosphonate ABC transporter ATP-binding protein [Cupriavidus sp.]MCA3205160.1 putative 2-aminoethylphosphonate ABC transporter ATP-binding protein [Cupriav
MSQPASDPITDLAKPFLSVRHVTRRFGAFTALDGVSLDVAQGEFVCLLGPSGCGKTTLLRIIAGLEAQDAGQIVAGERDISGLPPRDRDYGIVFQSYALFPNLTVAQNVAYGLGTTQGSRARMHARVSEMLALVGLSGSEAKYPSQLSGGQQQRVALARALAPAPSLLLLDEPMSALDAQVREHLRIELRRLQRKLNVTTLMVTHDQDEAMAMADRIAVMSNGRIEQVGSPAEIYTQPATAFVAGFVGQANWLPLERAADGTPTLAGKPLSIDARFAGSPAQSGRLFCRPEAVTLHADDDAPNRHLARVVDQIYLGSRTRLVLAIDGVANAPLVAEVASAALRTGPGDSKLWIALERDGLRVYA